MTEREGSRKGPIFHQLVLGPFVNNVYILGDAETKEAIVIDASFQAEKIVEAVRRLGLQVRTVLLTHGHIDHVAGSGVLKNALGAEIAIHAGDTWMYEHVGDQGRMFGFEVPKLPEPDRFVREGEELRFGSHTLKIVETPGHSPGSVCLRGELDGRPVAFTGDTLFCGSIGRTDLWGGDYGEILRSIRRKLLVLPGETLVLPGHGEESDVATEKRTNPFVGEGA